MIGLLLLSNNILANTAATQYDITPSYVINWPNIVVSLSINNMDPTNPLPSVSGLETTLKYYDNYMSPVSYSLGSQVSGARLEVKNILGYGSNYSEIKLMIIPSNNDNNIKVGEGEIIKITFASDNLSYSSLFHIKKGTSIGDRNANFLPLNTSGSIYTYYEDTLTILKGTDTNGDHLADDFEGDGIPDTYDTDDDNDGLPDLYENQYSFLNPKNAADATADYDGDGLLNKWEFVYNTKPDAVDSDGDGINDKAEVDAGTNPRDDISALITVINSLLLN